MCGNFFIENEHVLIAGSRITQNFGVEAKMYFRYDTGALLQALCMTIDHRPYPIRIFSFICAGG